MTVYRLENCKHTQNITCTNKLRIINRIIQCMIPVCRTSKSLLIFIRKSLGMTWKYLEAFGFQVLPSHLEEFYSEECKLNLEIHLESFGSAKD